VQLNTAQIKKIYDGAYTNWRQLAGPNLPVRSISTATRRPATWRTCRPEPRCRSRSTGLPRLSEMSAGYPITINIGQLSILTPIVGRRGLAAAFLRYLSTTTALNDLYAMGYTPCGDADHPSAARLCAQAGS
jgi:hypothetical protein